VQKLIFLAARVAFGVEVILGAFMCGTKRPLKELHVLDAGKYAIAIKILVNLSDLPACTSDGLSKLIFKVFYMF
jgi:hypothetical protein